jgi:hypothetical protein
MSKVVRWAALALLSALAGAAQAQDTYLDTFKPDVWVCVSPKVYDEAMVRVAEFQGQDIAPLKKELADQKKCMYVDEELVDSMQAPFAIILKRDGTKVQVQFVVTFRKRIELLHRLTNRYVMQGWTEQSNLVKKRVM